MQSNEGVYQAPEAVLIAAHCASKDQGTHLTLLTVGLLIGEHQGSSIWHTGQILLGKSEVNPTALKAWINAHQRAIKRLLFARNEE